jgi:hypothetical protein
MKTKETKLESLFKTGEDASTHTHRKQMGKDACTHPQVTKTSRLSLLELNTLGFFWGVYWMVCWIDTLLKQRMLRWAELRQIKGSI